MVPGPSAGDRGPQTQKAGNRQRHNTQYIVAHPAVIFRGHGDGNGVNDQIVETLAPRARNRGRTPTTTLVNGETPEMPIGGQDLMARLATRARTTAVPKSQPVAPRRRVGGFSALDQGIFVRKAGGMWRLPLQLASFFPHLRPVKSAICQPPSRG